MSELIFSDKRDENKLLLRYSAFNFTYNLAKQSFKKIKNYDSYKILINNFPEKYIESYYQKIFFEAFSNLGSQSVINFWHKKNEGNFLKKKIIADTFLPKELLDSIWTTEEFNYKIYNKKGYIKKLKNKIYPFYLNFQKYKNKFKIKNQSDDYKNSNIAVNYIEGHDLNKRSDLYWFKDSEIDPASVILYFESKQKMLRYSNYHDLISELSSEELDFALSMIDETIEEVDIRITAARSILVQ